MAANSEHYQDQPPGRAERIHLGVLGILQTVMGVELIWLIVRGQWLHAVLVAGIMTLTLAPVLLGRRLPAQIPSEIQLLAILFIFATLFLGEVHDYYERFWWWDLVLHATAGLLMGLFGFLIVYMLNENALVDLRMRPSFVAFFAFTFAVTTGTLWEIFEFSMDQLFGMTMQKPMLGDPSGLTDTMWDMIVNATGAALVSLGGWRYMRRRRKAWLDSWARRFIDRHPRIFGSS
jgi:hypothetical protein